MSTPISKGPDSLPDRPDVPAIDPLIVKAMAGLPDDFTEFPRLFQDQIRPALVAREGARQAAAKTARQSTLIGAAVGAVGALLGLLVLRAPQAAIFAGMLGFMIHGFGQSRLRKIGKEAKGLLVSPVADKLGLQFDQNPGEVASIAEHRRVNLVPTWDRATYEDRVTGRRSGVDFELFEAHLEQRRESRDSSGRTQTRWVTVFRGQCLRFQFPKKFHGRTLVTRDAGWFNRFGGGGGMQRAKLEDPRFEKIFEVYTTDQVEARFLLTPDLMQKLVDMEEAFHGGGVKCCFDGGEMFITLEGGDLFEPGSMLTPLDNPEHIRELLGDFAAVFHIIDEVAARRSEREG